jgi:hypothetical protein
VLGLRSSNDQHKPAMDALKLIERYEDSSFTTYLSLGETMPLEGAVRKDWTEFAILTPDKGPKRVMRTGPEPKNLRKPKRAIRKLLAGRLSPGSPLVNGTPSSTSCL